MGNIISSLEDKLTDLTEAILTPENMQILGLALVKIHTFEFDVFAIDRILEKKTMMITSQQIFNKYEFFTNLINEENFKNFIREITDGYNRAVSYHNDLHGCDVMQTVYIFIEKGELAKVIKLIQICKYGISIFYTRRNFF
jgi:hypothetical protein